MPESGLNMKDSAELARWLRDDTATAPTWIKVAKLYDRWNHWALTRHGVSCSAKAFTQALVRLGIKTSRISSGTIAYGLKLKEAPRVTRRLHAPNPVIDAILIGLDGEPE